ENGTTIGGDIFLDYFFSPNRRWGIGLGAMYLRHTGNLTMDDFRVDYKAVIQSGQDKGKEFRQLIRSTGPVTEEVKIDNINIPVLLKYKWTFAKRGERP